jgi:hypothetical protein
VSLVLQDAKLPFKDGKAGQHPWRFATGAL